MSEKNLENPELNNDPGVPEEIAARAARVELIALDVDGVLTDGHTWQLDNGEQLLCFHAPDGTALNLCHLVGVKLAILSGRSLPAAKTRMNRFPIEELHLGVKFKSQVMDGICERQGVPLENVAFLGDDLIDLELLGRVGLPVAVPNAVPEVLAAAVWITERRGGEGGVRDLITLVLKARGQYVKAVHKYLEDH
jgi:3-deoxy-D-manno-octulosonate 8-phosphate phosphatase (KDO 8-P phosphatase)